MYQKISIAAFLVTFLAIGAGCLLSRCRKCQGGIVRRVVHLFTLLFVDQKLSLIGVLRKLVYLLALLCFVVLAITGFYPTVVLDEHISGWLIMIHATFAPVFAITLAVLAVLWADKCRFVGGDWPWLQRLIERVTLVKPADDEQAGGCIGQKITFWLIIFLALPLILSIILSMLPYFGTGWQELFLLLHRYTALIFALAVIVHTYLMIRTQMK